MQRRDRAIAVVLAMVGCQASGDAPDAFRMLADVAVDGTDGSEGGSTTTDDGTTGGGWSDGTTTTEASGAWTGGATAASTSFTGSDDTTGSASASVTGGSGSDSDAMTSTSGEDGGRFDLGGGFDLGVAPDLGGGGSSCAGFPATPPAGLCCNSMSYFWDPNSWCSNATTITSEGECIQAGGGPPPFQVWLRLHLGTDQRVAVPVQHAGLVGRDGMATWVSDDDLARELSVHFGNAGHDVRLAAYFSECFGGGMIDDIVYRFGNHEDLCDVPFLLSSASRYDQVAYYPLPGIDDWGNALIAALAETGNALGLAWNAALNDTFAPFDEMPQYIARNGGENLDVGAERDRGIAILWSGRPARPDGEQIAGMIANLRDAQGWSCDRIFVMYGDGQLPANHPIQMERGACGAKQFVLSRAVKNQLVRLLNAAFLGGWNPKPEFVFFFANDHGYSTAVGGGAATPREGADIEEDYEAGNDPDGGLPGFPGPG
jgi:hypothetical protein